MLTGLNHLTLAVADLPASIAFYGPAADYTHYAFGIAAADFARFAAQLRAHGVREWKQNRSEGDSFYFLDPDGHRLEAHVGDLRSRLAACRQAPYAGMRFAD